MILPGLILFATLSIAVQDPLKLGPSAEKFTEDDVIEFDENAPIEMQVDQILSQMTLEEKAGQMVFTSFKSYDNTPPKIVKEWIREDKVGFLRLRDGPNPEKTAELLNQVQKWAMNSDPPIPIIIYMDSIHGISYIQDATIYPHAIGLAATENLELIKKLSNINAKESRAVGIHESCSPTADVATEPRWGRVQATYGENYKFVSKAVKNTIQAFQGKKITENSILAITKHFPGAGPEKHGKDWGDDPWSTIVSDENTLKNIHLKPFETAIKTDTASIMPYYSNLQAFETQANIGPFKIPDKIHTRFYIPGPWFGTPSIPVGTLRNDTPSMGSKKVVRYLRENMNYDGIVTSDWFPIQTLMTYGYGYKESYKMVLNSDTDVFGRVMANTIEEQIGKNLPFLASQDQIVELVRSGKISENRINKSVRKIIRVKLKLGLFRNPYVDPEKARKIVGSKTHQQTNLKAAEQSLTLLKNENVLPLSKNLDSILVAGPRSNSMRSLLGGWSVGGTITGGQEQTVEIHGRTILEAIENKTSETTKIHHVKTNSEKAENLAKKTDAAILCLGEDAYIHSSPWGPYQLSLSKKQKKLIKNVNKHTPTIVTLSMGRPYIIPYLKKKVPGILAIYYPGNKGGEAVANLIFGDSKPEGSLPFRMPSSMNAVKNQEEDVPFDIKKYTYKEGHGLSYPTISNSNIELSQKDKNAVYIRAEFDFSSYESGHLRTRWKKENQNWKITEWKKKYKEGVFKENISKIDTKSKLTFQVQLKYKTKTRYNYENQIINSRKMILPIPKTS